MPQSSLDLVAYGNDTPPANVYYGDGVALNRELHLGLSEGVGADQFSVAFAKEFTIAGLGTQAVDLRTDNDAYGVNVLGTDLLGLFIESVEGSAGGTLQVEPGAVNPLSSFLAVGSVLKLPTPSFVFLLNRTAGRVVINAGVRALLLRNTHATLAVTARVIALVRK